MAQIGAALLQESAVLVGGRMAVRVPKSDSIGWYATVDKPINPGCINLLNGHIFHLLSPLSG